MRLTNTLKNGALLLALGTATFLPLNSAQAAQPGAYLGMGFGSAHDEILNEDESAFKFYGGVNLSHYIGMELGYVDLGSYANGALTQDGISYELVGYIPLSSQIDLYGKAGFFNWEVANAFTSNTGTDATFGVGLQAQLQHHVSLRGEYQTFLDVDGGDVDLYSASINLHF
jgi:OOP family OmpA-OmpF porin